MFPSQIKTGFGIVNNDNDIHQKDLMLKVEALLITLLEECIQVAALYVNESKRTSITSTDMLYAIQYQAREFFRKDELIKNIDENYKSLKEESDEESDEDTDEDTDEESGETDEESDEEIEDSDEEPFTRCDASTNEIVNLMNTYHDNWSEWIPTEKYEILLKKAIDEKFLMFD